MGRLIQVALGAAAVPGAGCTGAAARADDAAALTRGIAPDGTRLIPTMPYNDFAGLTDADKQAVAAYLLSLPPIPRAVPSPTKPGEAATAPYMTVVMPK
jgi:hypothetical protein